MSQSLRTVRSYPRLITLHRYKLAEKLSDRLDDMGKDLGSMIAEINSTSTTLSKTTKADEPVCHLLLSLKRSNLSATSTDLANRPGPQLPSHAATSH